MWSFIRYWKDQHAWQVTVLVKSQLVSVLESCHLLMVSVWYSCHLIYNFNFRCCITVWFLFLFYYFLINNFPALTLLNTRAYSMQEASEEVGSGMLTMTISHQSKLGLAKEAAMKFCKSECGILNPVVQTASYLTPYHKVVAGHNEVCASSV